MTDPSILLVEDNPAEQRLALEAFKQSRWKPKSTVVDDGQEALDFLSQTQSSSKDELPDLIILDLNLPRMDGREFLEKVRHDPRFQNIPIVVFTSSLAKEDIDKCYALCANSYVQKPVGLDQFFQKMNDIQDYWFDTSTTVKQ